jgi:hypothetical protein
VKPDVVYEAVNVAGVAPAIPSHTETVHLPGVYGLTDVTVKIVVLPELGV